MTGACPSPAPPHRFGVAIDVAAGGTVAVGVAVGGVVGFDVGVGLAGPRAGPGDVMGRAGLHHTRRRTQLRGTAPVVVWPEDGKGVPLGGDYAVERYAGTCPAK